MSEDISTRIRIRFNHAASRKILDEKYHAKMLFAHNGGMWQAGPELLTTLQTVLDQDYAVILDTYRTPVKIVPTDLYTMALQRWQEQMNAWLCEFENLQSQR